MAEPDYVKKKYGPLLRRTLKARLMHRIHEHWPRLGGPRVLAACVDVVLEEVERHVAALDRLEGGQMVWLAIAADDPPRRRQRAEDTHLVPVVLTVSAPEDVQARLDRQSPEERLLTKAVRLCRQAHDQGALLGNTDLAELLTQDERRVSKLVRAYEQETGTLVPRRATLHDVGSGVTHKGLICRKYYREGKSPLQIARETHHSPEAVERYLLQWERVRACLADGKDVAYTAFLLECSPALVKEYQALIEEMEQAEAPDVLH